MRLKNRKFANYFRQFVWIYVLLQPFHNNICLFTVIILNLIHYNEAT